MNGGISDDEFSDVLRKISELHGIDDCIINKLEFYYSNHKENLEEFLEKIKKYGTIIPRNLNTMIILELNKPITILVPDSEEKKFRKTKEFNKKIDKLYYLLENPNFQNTPETNEAIDKLITVLSQYADDEDIQDDEE